MTDPQAEMMAEIGKVHAFIGSAQEQIGRLREKINNTPRNQSVFDHEREIQRLIELMDVHTARLQQKTLKLAIAAFWPTDLQLANAGRIRRADQRESDRLTAEREREDAMENGNP